ncbi:MAG: hypothetical protein KGN40_12600 [Burkholderiales bacterium]|nr:hypothetical protein [Burkholderiales bacterium]
MKLRVRLPAALLALNWALFAMAFIWTCKAQENLLWWLRLDWAGWLGELPELMQLGTVSASTVWILWLCLTLLLTAAWLVPGAARPATAEKPTSADVASRVAPSIGPMVDADPALKEKLLRLHQSLDKL